MSRVEDLIDLLPADSPFYATVLSDDDFQSDESTLWMPVFSSQHLMEIDETGVRLAFQLVAVASTFRA